MSKKSKKEKTHANDAAAERKGENPPEKLKNKEYEPSSSSCKLNL